MLSPLSNPDAHVPTLPLEAYRELVACAIAEDRGAGDITTQAIVPAETRGSGSLIVKSSCVIAGLAVAEEVCRQVDVRLAWRSHVRDGDRGEPGDLVATVTGPAVSLLSAERTLLNFLQHLSGIATLTRAFVDASGGRVTILDTRKTLPTLRALEKYAVLCGGGTNHRFGLFDGVLIKDNHIRVAASIGAAVTRMRAALVAAGTEDMRIEVETQSLEQVQEALAAGADVIMLDNLDVPTMVTAVRMIGGRARVEISGGVTLDRVPELATLGADFVSVGALTHSAAAADISLEIETD
jgi:nicotinate-nucleotide pyrophosphorylase (carboxylating)